MVNLLPLIPALPLAGALLLVLGGRYLRRYAGHIATLTMTGSFTLSIMAFGEMLQKSPGSRRIVSEIFDWVTVGNLHVPMKFALDQLTVVMLLVVTGVGTLIHIYSIGYMAQDERKSTFFGYLNLFAGSMVILVMGANLLVLFLGWELVGLCSYLLISFWNHKPEAAAAGKKAFIVNRVGDFGFLIAIFLAFARFGTLDIAAIGAQASAHPSIVIAAIPLLLLLGATGKSAQVPLYVWLPDAMEGPTPVSALIHAATMVTAGVYMIARLHVLFEAVPVAGLLVVVIGIVTAALAATIAMAQDDIKRVLAYSTISQIGYMFIGVGIGALTGSPLPYVAAVFHLVTHAFFKALLFLGAGSVMHATGGITNMKQMGGLLRKIPITGVTFIIGWLAIAGIPPLSGFFSKDAIIGQAWQHGLPVVWFAAVGVAVLTSLYMSRQVFLVFFGKSRLPEDIAVHESPEVMTVVLRSLAVLAAIGGVLNLSLRSGALTSFLGPVFSASGPPEIERTPLGLGEGLVSVLIAALSAGAIFLAYRLYVSDGALERREAIKIRISPLVRAARNKFYVDEIYNWLIVWPGKTLASLLAFRFDVGLIDGAVDAIASSVSRGAEVAATTQSGHVRRYVMTMLGGVVLILALLLVRLR